MPKAADGEYELVLENRQVLTIFFVAVVLCGVFFGLGYVVGKNTVGYVPATEASSGATEGKKSALDKSSAAEKKEESAPPTTDLTAQKDLQDKSAPAKLESKPEPAPAATAPATTPAPKPAVASETSTPRPAPAAATQTVISLQVAALSNKGDADALVTTLKKKNIQAFVNSDGHLFRVQVGPFASAREAEDMKVRLEQEGFKPIKK